ncbi:hypothetical protein ABEB36_007251 [Hypothenemus hampei]|uniref:Uncharacterized protein n=1 Tax=Hypothenemus hampei TaxID=57062 RepID=A0ABD1ETE1_HYPHA
MSELRPHQDELLVLADLAGIHMDQEIFRSLVELLNMGVGPDAIYNLLKILRKRQNKGRRSHGSQRISKYK